MRRDICMQDAIAPAESLGDVLLARELKKVETLTKRSRGFLEISIRFCRSNQENNLWSLHTN